MNARRLLAALIASAALLAPVAAQAAGPVKVKADIRVYDSEHKDYHVWDAHEDTTYRGYLADQHMKYRVYSKQNTKQQSAYWNWRHTHG